MPKNLGGAHAAGILPGDVILEVNGNEVTGISKLKKLISTSGIGKKIKLKVFRKGKEIMLDIVTHKNTESSALSSYNTDIGMSVRNISVSDIARNSLKDDAEGVVVSAIEKGSVADYVNIVVNDVIQEVNGQAIKNTKDFEAVYKNNRGNGALTFSILRDGNKTFVYVEIAD